MKQKRLEDYLLLLKYAHDIYTEIDNDEKVNEQILRVAKLYKKKHEKKAYSQKELGKLWKYIKSFEKDDREIILSEGKEIFKRK